MVFVFIVSQCLGENTSIRPAEDLTQETEGSIYNEWSPTWGSESCLFSATSNPANAQTLQHSPTC